MTPRLPALGAKRVLRALQRGGFVVERTSGSHSILIHPADPARRVVVPYHGSRDLPNGTVRAILRQAGLTVEEFLKLL